MQKLTLTKIFEREFKTKDGRTFKKFSVKVGDAYYTLKGRVYLYKEGDTVYGKLTKKEYQKLDGGVGVENIFEIFDEKEMEIVKRFEEIEERLKTIENTLKINNKDLPF